MKGGDGIRTHEKRICNPLPGSVTNADTSTSEHAPATPSNSPSSSTATDPPDADLRRVVEAWPELPPAIRAGILAMVQASAAPWGEQEVVT